MLSSSTACMPWLSINADAALALRSPASLLLEVQADKLPVSNPSAKIRSETLEVGVGVLVGAGVLVGEAPTVLVGVLVGVRVGVKVLVGVTEMIGVCVRVGVAVLVGVMEGVFVGIGAVARKLNASTSLADKFQVLPSKYKVDK